MTDVVPERLRAAGRSINSRLGSAAELRSGAEHRRRGRRAAGGVAALVVVLALTTGSIIAANHSTSTPPASAQLTPPNTDFLDPTYYAVILGRERNVVIVLESSAVSDRPTWQLEVAFQAALVGERGRCPDSSGGCWSTGGGGSTPPAMFELTPDPLLTGADLQVIDGLIGSPHDDLVRTASVPSQMTPCTPDFNGIGAAVVRSAAYTAVQSDANGLHLNEFVLWFEDESAASHAYARVRQAVVDCPTHSDYGNPSVWFDEDPVSWDWPVDAAFVAELKTSG